MKLASHNSMTYLPPKKWYLYPFQFMAKCQRKDIKEQYLKYNVRMFDIRVHYDKSGNLEFKHGLMAYKGGRELLGSTLAYLNKKKSTVYVRFILEVNKSNNTIEKETLFIKDCMHIQNKYKHIIFLEGVRKYDWKKLYNFNTVYPDLRAYFSSITKIKIDDLWPWLYAKLYNKKVKKEPGEYIMLDFVDID